MARCEKRGRVSRIKRARHLCPKKTENLPKAPQSFLNPSRSEVGRTRAARKPGCAKRVTPHQRYGALLQPQVAANFRGVIGNWGGGGRSGGRDAGNGIDGAARLPGHLMPGIAFSRLPQCGCRTFRAYSASIHGTVSMRCRSSRPDSSVFAAIEVQFEGNWLCKSPAL